MTPQQFKSILQRHKKIAIVGGPQSGKTTMSNLAKDRPVFHNDEAKHLSWEEQPEYWKRRVEGHDSYVIEGVQAARALRKGLQVDAVVEMNEPRAPRSKGQEAMAKGHTKIFKDVTDSQPGLKVYR